MNQDDIFKFLNDAEDAGFDVQAILNQVMTIRRGRADVALRNKSFEKNRHYLFAIKEPNDKDYWPWGLVVVITHEDYWNKYKAVSDCHLSNKIDIPAGFGEEMESTFSFQGSIEEGTRLLQAAGFRHSKEMQQSFEGCDP